MTDNEIIERLQFLLKIGDAPIGKGFGVVIDKQDILETLALIKKQQAEIDYWKQQAFNGCMEKETSIKIARAEAIKEFEDKLYNYIISNKQVNEVMIIEKMTSLKKEMVGAE